ncbi:hypothetical protein DPV78_003229 [Talaromyces pinophilus]|nr:hypothetical protein DPV78_003229 [Talaromyces pinophilus]
MQGLRALCCFKDDRDVDHHTPPDRPAQRLQKKDIKCAREDQNEISSTDLTQDKPPSRNLWKEAYEKLESDTRGTVSTHGGSTTDATNSVILLFNRGASWGLDSTS